MKEITHIEMKREDLNELMAKIDALTAEVERLRPAAEARSAKEK